MSTSGTRPLLSSVPDLDVVFLPGSLSWAETIVLTAARSDGNNSREQVRLGEASDTVSKPAIGKQKVRRVDAMK